MDKEKFGTPLKNVTFAHEPNDPALESDGPAPWQFPILVDILIPSTRTLVARKANIVGLRRFSKVAEAKLPAQVTTVDPELRLSLELPLYGARAPSNEALHVVLEYMESNKDAKEPAPFQPEGLRSGNIEKIVDIYAACYSFWTNFGLAHLEFVIKKKIIDAALISRHLVTAQEFRAIWELLPPNHAILQHAIKCVLYQNLSGKTNILIRDMENLIYEDRNLRKIFEKERLKLQRKYGTTDWAIQAWGRSILMAR